MTFGNFTCEPIEKPSVKASIQDYCHEEAFICHSVDHWISIRKLYGVWYNLNSTNIVPPGPQIISDFYLAAFLDSIKNSGYTIFVVRQSSQGGQKLPLPNKYQFGNLRQNQMYVPVADIEKYHRENKGRGLNAGGADERELEEALKKSLQDSEEREHGGVGTILNGGKGGENKAPSFQAFKG